MRELASSPSMKLLYPKAVTGAVVPGGRANELPGEELVLRDVEIERERLEDYCRVCTFEIADTLPATYPHLLAFPLSMQLMTARSFPFSVMGLVHIENRIDQLRPIGVDERLDLTVAARDLRPHDKGRQFDLVAEATSGGETVWRSASTYLKRGGGGDGGGSKGGEREQPPEPDAVLAVPGDIGRRYGAVSGDRNPIHLHPLSARLFGMPKPIAHGMWLKARCLALLEGRLPDAFTVEARFKLPVYIPGKVSFASDGDRFSLHDAKNEKPHLAGAIRGSAA
jgi:hypothetical protein